MKSKEEILKLSYAYSDKVNMSKDMTSLSIADAVTYGYNQCQEDSKDKKYTEEDIRNAIREGRNSIHFEISSILTKLNSLVAMLEKNTGNDGSWWEDETVEEDFINSLNKQD
jgi:hypothetical protein